MKRFDLYLIIFSNYLLILNGKTWLNEMEMERIIETKSMETTHERRKGLILYPILFSNYLLILILWKDMTQ